MEARIFGQSVASRGSGGNASPCANSRFTVNATRFPQVRPSFDTGMPCELGTMPVTGGAAEKKSHAHI
jgi:hypothetical protein